MKDIFETYLRELKTKYKTGQATEASHYPALEKLFKGLMSFYKQPGTIIPIPRRTEIGVPDFRIIKKNNLKIGEIEAKDIFEDLNKISKSEQLKRYLETLDNLILTNYLEFWLFREGKRIETLKVLDNYEFEKRERFRIGEIDKIEEFFESFFSYSIKPIYKSKDLAVELAKRTKLLKINTLELLHIETKKRKGKLHGILKAFKEYLISDLNIEDFSDMYAQTISYGLLLAKINADRVLDRTLAHRYIPKTISLLNDLFRHIGEEDLPKELAWIVEDVANVLNATDIGNIRKEMYEKVKTEDPIMHFYETFLAAYNPKLRKSRGVYYTPLPVVSFIVRSCNILLKENFGKSLGFADKDVKILDPACGTGTFLGQIINLINEEVMQSPKRGVIKDVLRGHVLQDIYGFELLMAPYSVSHLKLALALKDYGYELKEDERFKIYLTNTLESKASDIIYLPFYESLTRESAEAQKVKDKTPILVVLGNPPYSVSSYNKADFIEKLMEDYKKDVRKERNIQPLSDDYIKFIRFAQWKIEQGGKGIFAYISNNSYLSGLIHRGMRRRLLESFDEIYILNLHGSSRIGESCPDGSKDENVFDIMQGVAIGVFVRTSPQPSAGRGTSPRPSPYKGEGEDLTRSLSSRGEGQGEVRSSPPRGEGQGEVYYADLWGLREVKNNWLLANDIKTAKSKWRKLAPKSPNYFFIPKELKKEKEYNQFWSVETIFLRSNIGVATGQDKKFVSFTEDELKKSLKDIENFELNKLKTYNYRPFDLRFIYYDVNLLQRARKEIIQHLLNPNIALVVTKQLSTPKFKHSFITNEITDRCLVSLTSREGRYIFPVYLYPDKGENKLFEGKVDKRIPNLNPEFVENLTRSLSLKGEGGTSPQPSPYEGEGTERVPSFLRRGYRGGLEQRRELRKNLTPAERKLWQKLRNKQLSGFKFRRQHQIDRFIVDFYCPAVCLIIEIDGDVHVKPQQAQYDKIRQQELKRRGFKVVRYTNNEVKENLGGVLEDIHKKCGDLTRSLSLKGQGEDLTRSLSSRGEGQDLTRSLSLKGKGGDLTSSLSSRGEGQGEVVLSPEQVFYYIYGILHSHSYRTNYTEFLKIDFPRIPFTKDLNLLLETAKIGEEIAKLHLLESPLLEKLEADYPVDGDHFVDKIVYDEKDERIFINKKQYFGKVSKEIWQFTVGGCQVLDKYLKARRKRNVSADEIDHILKVITAIKHTREKMKIADQLFKKMDLKNLLICE